MNQNKGALPGDDETTRRLGPPNTETEPLIDESCAPDLQAENEALRAKLDILKAQFEALEAKHAEVREELINVKYKTGEFHIDPLDTSPILDEEEALILAMVGKLNQCKYVSLKWNLTYRLHMQNKSSLIDWTINKHLDELRKRGLVKAARDEFKDDIYTLTPEGRDYFVKHNLSSII
jgi:hypothetical protein